MTTMEEARKAVEDFLTRSGHHDTTVTERVAPAIYLETVTKNELEEVTTVIDKEIHQDHYHISVQPIDDEETLSEQHSHNLVTIEHRHFQHEDEVELQARLAEEAAKFKDEVVRVEGKRSNVLRPVIAAEHIHHHVHELIQPVINKRTIETHIIHTTIPIHEVHRNAAHHHASSSLPAISLQEFRAKGGILTGREERYDFFEGEPRGVVSSQDKGSSTTRGTAPAAPAPAKPSASAATNSTDAQPAVQSDVAAVTPHPDSAPPIVPPHSSVHPSQALTLTHPPTFLPKHIYVRSHPSGVTGARPTPPPRPSSAGPAPPANNEIE